MKVLITGATGLVGSELIKMLLENGVYVSYLTTQKQKTHLIKNCEGYYWNPKKNKIDVNAFEGVDVIVHLAGASVAKRWTKKYKKELKESRINGIGLIYNALKSIKHQVKHVISASAIGVYPHSYTNVYSESENEIDDSFLGKLVRDWEVALDAFLDLNVKITKLRIGIVLSNEGGALMKMIQPIKWGLGAPFGNGKQYQSWIHINDLVRCFYFILENQYEGVYNAVSPYPIENGKLLKNIAKHLKKPFFLPNIPKFVMKLILGEMHEILFVSQNVSARKILDKGFQFKYPTIEKALQNLLIK